MFSLPCCACSPGSGQECVVISEDHLLSQAPALNNRHLTLTYLHSSRVVIGSPLGHEIYRAQLMHPVLYSRVTNGTPYVHVHAHAARAAILPPLCVHSASSSSFLPPPTGRGRARVQQHAGGAVTSPLSAPLAGMGRRRHGSAVPPAQYWKPSTSLPTSQPSPPPFSYPPSAPALTVLYARTVTVTVTLLPNMQFFVNV